jgi:hypothetical protein
VRIPAWMVVAAAVVAALPCGWGLGVVAAYLIAGPDFGVLPVATIPFGVLATMWFALSRRFGAWTRFTVLIVTTGLFLLFG